MAQPALRIKKVPTIKISKIGKSGTPLLANHSAHKVGHKSNSVPIGLSNLIRYA
jgi:hypothetical protein